MGTVAWEPHGIWIRDGAGNVVIDHVSISWAVWTSVGIVPRLLGGYRGEITILDSIVSESLACSGVNRAGSVRSGLLSRIGLFQLSSDADPGVRRGDAPEKYFCEQQRSAA